MLPSQFINLDINEMAFIIASIGLVIEAEKEAEIKAKRGK